MSVTIAMPRMSTDPELTTAQSKYVESLARAGAEVHWVALSDPDAAVAEALTCDGLLLPGGGDMDPAFYGQERIPACGEPNLLRDAAEPKLLRAFLAADKPVLGICRGIQVMNVVLGGTLYQDIKPFEHVPHNDHWAKVHTVTVRRGTLLSRYVGEEPTSQVTGLYNQIMCEQLPKAGIECVVVPRKEANGKAISASTVRQCLQSGDWDTLETLLPKTSLDYFRSPEAEPVLARIRNAGNVVHY